VHQGHADPVFDAYVIREQNGIPLAIIAQAFSYPPDANGAQFTPDGVVSMKHACRRWSTKFAIKVRTWS